MNKRAFLALYATPTLRAQDAAAAALDAVFKGGGVRAYRLFDRAAEAHQMAVYREHCARKLGIDQ